MICPKCGAEMVEASINGSTSGAPPYVSIKGKGILTALKRCSVGCFVCLECGKIELMAIDVEKLR